MRRRGSDDGTTLLEQAFFGPDGSPVAGPDGYHRSANPVYKKFIAERGRLSGEAVRMVVLRHGRPVQLTIPPPPEKTDGMEVTWRSVPRFVFGRKMLLRIHGPSDQTM